MSTKSRRLAVEARDGLRMLSKTGKVRLFTIAADGA
jgi:hypothetical protein